MSNLYQPTEVTGEEFTRCYQVIIDNPHNKPSKAHFQEERVLITNSAARRWPTGACSITYDEAIEIPILDPATGADTGSTITMAALYGLLYSAYLYTALARDAAAAPAEEPLA
jgi:hypothetical protein